jgi:glycosyltransferase involved in cell wall biosynthesis
LELTNAAGARLHSQSRTTASARVAVLMASVSRMAGGVFWAVRSLTEALHRKGAEIAVFGGLDECSPEDTASWRGPSVNAFPQRGPRSFGYQPELRSAVTHFSPDLLHVHGLWMYPSVVARWASKTTPHVISPHGMLDPWAVRNSAWKKALAGAMYENSNLARAKCIHALCEAEYSAIRRHGVRNPVAIVPNGVELPDLSEVVAIPDWRRRIPSDAKVLLYMGRIHPKKGLIALLHAWRISQQRSIATRGWHLVIAGWDQDQHCAQLHSYVADHNLTDGVHFVGPQFDAAKSATFLSADAFVLPSLSEGLPMAVLEAWSYSLPVLMTPECNLNVGFAAGAALRIDGAEGISSAIESLCEMNDQQRCDMGIRGRRLVEKQFQWSIVADAMGEVYDWMLGNASTPACVAMGVR